MHFLVVQASIVQPSDPSQPSSLQSSITDIKRARIRSVVLNKGTTEEQKKQKHRQMASLAAYSVATAVK